MIFLKKFPNLTVAISCLFWGTYWIPLRFIDRSSNSSVWPIILSFIFLALILIFPLYQTIKDIFFKKNFFFLFACVFCAFAITLYSESLLRGEIAKVVILFYLCPIWGTILARIFLNQRFNFVRISSIMFGLIGLEIIVGFDQGIFIPSTIVEWLAITAGFSWSVGMVFFHLAKSTSGINKTSITALLIPFLFLIFTLVPGGRSLEYSNFIFDDISIFFWIICFGLVWILPSIFLTYISVEVLDPGRINILLAFEVVVGFLSANFLTNEIIGLREIFGAFFVISACLIDVFFNNIKVKN